MLDTRDLYKDYISSVQNKIDMVATKISQYQGSEEYFKVCILNNRAEFEKINVNVDTLLANPFIAYTKIKELVDNGQLTRVAHYVKSYVSALNYLTLHKKLFDRLNKCIMPYEVYLKTIGYTNLEIAKHILRGGYYTLGSVGKLYIREKLRTFLFKGKPVRLPIDWGLSNKYKEELIKQGKVPYDQCNAPNGIKWHIYHNSDYAYWFWWEAGAIPNRGFFKFFPSKYCSIGNSRKASTLLTICKDKNEILDTTNIGNIDKMLLLMKFDPLHFLNYRRPEKEVNKYELNYVNN